MAKRVTKTNITYSEAIAELEQILSRLRNTEITIDELAPAVTRASALVEECRRQLEMTKEELEKITQKDI